VVGPFAVRPWMRLGGGRYLRRPPVMKRTGVAMGGLAAGKSATLLKPNLMVSANYETTSEIVPPAHPCKAAPACPPELGPFLELAIRLFSQFMDWPHVCAAVPRLSPAPGCAHSAKRPFPHRAAPWAAPNQNNARAPLPRLLSPSPGNTALFPHKLIVSVDLACKSGPARRDISQNLGLILARR
jgi:hypothetical protein